MTDLERFMDYFEPDAGFPRINPSAARTLKAVTVESFLTHFGGRSFNSGLLRVLTLRLSAEWDDLLRTFFPAETTSRCFAIGWDGRILALKEVDEGGRAPELFVFNPASADYVSASTDMSELLSIHLRDNNFDLLDAKGFNDWLSAGNPGPEFHECVGYNRLLFQGGVNNLENRSLIDVAIYWEMVGYLIADSKKGSMKVQREMRK